jgi:nitrogen fixation protein FixH
MQLQEFPSKHVMSNTTIDTSNPTPGTKASRHLLWPILLTSLIGIHIISVVVMVIVATHDRSFAIEPDWYQKGLHYDDTAQQQRENSRLDWSVKLVVGPAQSGSNRRDVTCTVLDHAGKPVEKATIDLMAFAHLRASNRVPGLLLPHDGGRYEGSLGFDDPGMWEFRLVIKRGAETFTQIIRQEI